MKYTDLKKGQEFDYPYKRVIRVLKDFNTFSCTFASPIDGKTVRLILTDDFLDEISRKEAVLISTPTTKTDNYLIY